MERGESDLRNAILNIGTNTVLLLIVEAGADGALCILRDDHAIARLGEGVDRTHIISEAAYSRFSEVMRKHAAVIHSLNVERITAVGTSALRDAKNREEIIQTARTEFGIEIEMLSGEEEARWGYTGALFGMTLASRSADGICVIDIGGGSTEISFGNGKDFSHGVSLDIGAVRLQERYFTRFPTSQEAEHEARRLIRSELKNAKVSEKGVEQVIAVAGTPTTLAAMDQQLEHFNPASVQDYRLSLEATGALLDMLLRTPTSRILELYPVVNKSRADILPAGTMILLEAMKVLGVNDVRVSAHGLRYGIAMRELRRSALPA